MACASSVRFFAAPFDELHLRMTAKPHMTVRLKRSWLGPTVLCAGVILSAAAAIVFFSPHFIKTSKPTITRVQVALDVRIPTLKPDAKEQSKTGKANVDSVSFEKTLSSSKLKEKAESPDVWLNALSSEESREAGAGRAPLSRTAIEKLRDSVKVDLEEIDEGARRVSLVVEGLDCAEKSSSLELVAKSLKSQLEEEAKQAVQQRKEDLRRSTEKSQQDYQHALSMLKAYRERLAKKGVEDRKAEEKRKEQERLRTASTDEAVKSRLTQNPDWTEIMHQIDYLQRTRSSLEDELLPTHPQVQAVQAQIDELLRSLSKVPRWLKPKQPDPKAVSAEANPAVALEEKGEERVFESKWGESWLDASDAADISEKLLHQVETSAKDYQTAAQREKAAVAVVLPELKIDSRKTQSTISQAVPRSIVARAAFGSAAVLVLGLGFLFAGFAVEKPLGSLAELEPLFSVPVLGVTYNEAGDRAVRQIVRRRRFAKATLLAFGWCCFAALATTIFYFAGLGSSF